MNMMRSLAALTFTVISSLSLLNLTHSATAQTKGGDQLYQPQVGQPGKDVVWVPTGDELVTKMLQTAKVGKDDLLYDLGAGDGKIAIAAGREFGARAIGIEYNPEMAALAQRNAERAGVADRVKIIRGDIFKEDFSKATVITMYLLPDLNLKLRPTLLKLKPGTRLVTNSFTMGDWEPDQVINSSGNTGYFWVVPAQVEGRWMLKGLEGHAVASLDLTQRYQRVGGTISLGSNPPQPLLGVDLNADELRFRYLDSSNQLQHVKATIRGNSMDAELIGTYANNRFSGKRQ
ncbi:MAG: class I SAM-dependent methyltransferase [Betaproteobacteria bacterium]|nr:class I SAM-dependent methyltransferase [Betaproteobacteria bacterium]